MDQFGFRDREFDLQLVPPLRKGAEETLEATYVGAVGGRGNRQGEVVHVGQHDPSGYGCVEGSYIDEEQQRGYGGALWCPDFDRGLRTGGSLKDQGAGAFSEEGGDPINHV